MQIFLTPQCDSLTGFVEKGLGYHIQRRKNRLYGVRKSKGLVPPDGHIRFIFACAELAHRHLQVSDILVPWTELSDALKEAHHWIAQQQVNANANAKLIYNAADILNLKTLFGL